MQNSLKNHKIGLQKNTIKSSKYNLFPCDLNEPKELEELMEMNDIDFSKPTMVITECVLVYLNEGVVDQLYDMFAKKIKNLVWVDYEMFNQNDGFGKVMVKNFQGMGIPLYSIQDFDSVD